jgi:hypothetical protein
MTEPTQPPTPPQPPTLEMEVLPPTPKATPARVETVTTTDPDLVEELREALSRAYSVSLRMKGIDPAELPDAMEKRLREAVATMPASNIALAFDIRVWDKNGPLIALQDQILLPYFVEQTMIPESRRNFEAVIYAQLMRPLLNRIQSFLNRFTVNENPVPAEPPFGRNDVRPTIPPPGSKAFLSDAG